MWEGDGQVALWPSTCHVLGDPSCSPEEQGCLLAEQKPPLTPALKVATASLPLCPGGSLWSRPVLAPSVSTMSLNLPQRKSCLLCCWNQVTRTRCLLGSCASEPERPFSTGHKRGCLGLQPRQGTFQFNTKCSAGGLASALVKWGFQESIGHRFLQVSCCAHLPDSGGEVASGIDRGILRFPKELQRLKILI